MLARLRSADIFILLTYLILSAVPFAPIAFGNVVERPLDILATEYFLWLIVWAVFKRPAWFHWFLLPAFVALPVQLYLNYFYEQGISVHHLGIIAETSPKEAMEFLGTKIWLLSAVLILSILWWAYGLKSARQSRVFDWTHTSRWIVLALFLPILAVWVYGQEVGVEPDEKASVTPLKTSASLSAKAASQRNTEPLASIPANTPAALPTPTPFGLPKLPSWAKLSLDLDGFERTWPFGLVVIGANFGSERRYLETLALKNASFHFGAHQAAQSNGPQVVVMVIGESSRYDRWSLNGYERETNPLLGKEANLVSLSDVITSVSATRLSVPIIVTRKAATQSLKAGFSEKSFVTAFKEAGFKTYWLTNQMSFGKYDTPVSVFAKEADSIQYLNLGGFANTSNFDAILLAAMKNALHDPASKKLIVLHTLGNHWNYSHRHPPEFEKWKPSLSGVIDPVVTDKRIKPRMSNSYDNSMLYVDWMLSQVIDTLKASDQLASMMFVSDHGELLYDGSCDLAFHGHNTQYDFHVPAFVWYSDQYEKIYPQKIAQLRRNRDAKLTTENIFHSLLDMADIRYAGERLAWSFMSPQLERHRRYVDSYGWTDYDNATLKGDCREVMDKGKRLVQER